MSQPGAPRLHFANQLRGVAALVVMFSHLVGVFWLMQPFLAMTTLAPAQGGPIPALVTTTTVEWFEPGPFGVGLFFLISGLVVPISLERHSVATFVAARALRIYPTYVAGLAVQLLVLAAASQVWRQPLPYAWTTILANMLLVHDLTGQPSIDLVNWTLTIELRFYVLIALLAPWIRRGKPAAVLIAAIIGCMAAFLIAQGAFGEMTLDGLRPLYAVSSALPFMILMLTGVLFNFHVRGRIGAPALVAGVGAMAAMVAFAWWFSVLRGQFTHVLNNDGYALVLFGALYACRGRIGANRLLDRLAAISYPLYLVHATVGYVVMKALMLLLGWDYLPALAMAVLAAGVIACGLHMLVEKPCIRIGHALAGFGAWRAVRPRAS